MMHTQSCQQSSVVIFLVQNHLIAWECNPAKSPQPLAIEGAQAWLACDRADLISQALADLDERLGSQYPLQLIYDASSKEMLEAGLPKLLQRLMKRDWQILCYEPLAKRCALNVNNELPDRSLLAELLLPMLFIADNASERQRLQAATHRENEALTNELQRERETLIQENERLAAQNAMLRRVDAEQLLSYLPALYPRVFNVIGGTDLALLAGHIEPFNIPNPYPEPSPGTLHQLQRQFCALPTEVQHQIVSFIERLPQRPQLSPRPEMRSLIEQFEAKKYA